MVHPSFSRVLALSLRTLLVMVAGCPEQTPIRRSPCDGLFAQSCREYCQPEGVTPLLSQSRRCWRKRKSHEGSGDYSVQNRRAVVGRGHKTRLIGTPKCTCLHRTAFEVFFSAFSRMSKRGGGKEWWWPDTANGHGGKHALSARLSAYLVAGLATNTRFSSWL